MSTASAFSTGGRAEGRLKEIKNEKMDKDCDSCCRGRGFDCLVRISTRAACGQSPYRRRIADGARRPVGAASRVRALLQHFAPDGRYRNHLPDGRWYSCTPSNEFQHIKRS